MNNNGSDCHFEELTFPNYFLPQINSKIFILLIIDAHFCYTISHEILRFFGKKKKKRIFLCLENCRPPPRVSKERHSRWMFEHKPSTPRPFSRKHFSGFLFGKHFKYCSQRPHAAIYLSGLNSLWLHLSPPHYW